MKLPRSTKPSAGDKYYTRQVSGGYSTCIQGKPTDPNCDVLANCVGFACGFYNEQNDLGYEKYHLNCNAENFIERAIASGLSVVKEPVVGGVMVWQKGATLNGSDGAGHVAGVYAKPSDTQVKTAESGYGSSAFWTATRNKGNGNWGAGSGYTYRGCIVPLNYNPSTPSKSTSNLKYKKGDKVKFTGTLYRDSAGNGVGQSRTNLIATIYLVNQGTKCPYNINNGLGWVREEDLTPVETYTKGNYKTNYEMYVRTGAGTSCSIKKVGQLTADGKKNATSSNANANAVYKTGTVFTALEIISNSNGIWARTPSGYVCIQGASGIKYCSKI